MVYNHKERSENDGDITVTDNNVKKNEKQNIYGVGGFDESLPDQNNDDTVEKNENVNIYDVGVANEYLPEKNNDNDDTH